VKKVAIAFAVAALLGIVAGPLWALPEQSLTRVKRVALFKNGLGYFVLEAQLPSTTVDLGPLPAASHGTFWLNWPREVNVTRCVADTTTTTQLVNAVTIPDLISANVGKKVRLYERYLSGEQMPVVEGTICSCAQERTPPEPDPYISGPGPDTRRMQQPALVTIQTDTGAVAINPLQIQRVDFLDQPPNTTFPREIPAYTLTLDLAEPAPGHTVTVSYLAKGITWAPSYMIDVSDPKTAALSAEAVIVNEVQDLDGVPVDLITGFPHLQFADVITPMAMKEKLAGFLASLGRGGSEQAQGSRAAGVMSQRAAYGYQDYAQPSVLPEYGAAAAGQVAEDLFLYPLDAVRLAKGETGYYPLFTERVSYNHIYQWDIPDYVNEQDQYGRNRQESEEPEVVWHSLRLRNDTNLPWTTAPAETVKDGQILGQDTLNYTPVGAETTVKITQAVGVKAEQVELEVNRERDKVHMYGDPFDLVTIDGRLRIRNFKSEPITLEISKTLSGEVKANSPEAKITQLARGLTRMNPVNSLKWTLEIAPGEEKDVTYTYDVLIRR